MTAPTREELAMALDMLNAEISCERDGDSYGCDRCKWVAAEPQYCTYPPRVIWQRAFESGIIPMYSDLFAEQGVQTGDDLLAEADDLLLDAWYQWAYDYEGGAHGNQKPHKHHGFRSTLEDIQEYLTRRGRLNEDGYAKESGHAPNEAG